MWAPYHGMGADLVFHLPVGQGHRCVWKCWENLWPMKTLPSFFRFTLLFVTKPRNSDLVLSTQCTGESWRGVPRFFCPSGLFSVLRRPSLLFCLQLMLRRLRHLGLLGGARSWRTQHPWNWDICMDQTYHGKYSHPSLIVWISGKSLKLQLGEQKKLLALSWIPWST